MEGNPLYLRGKLPIGWSTLDENITWKGGKMNWETVGGHEVICLHYVPRNSAGELVTYPLKGSIIIKQKPLKFMFTTWSAYGIRDVVWNKHPELNLKRKIWR